MGVLEDGAGLSLQWTLALLVVITVRLRAASDIAVFNPGRISTSALCQNKAPALGTAAHWVSYGGVKISSVIDVLL